MPNLVDKGLIFICGRRTILTPSMLNFVWQLLWVEIVFEVIVKEIERKLWTNKCKDLRQMNIMFKESRSGKSPITRSTIDCSDGGKRVSLRRGLS